MRRSLKLAYLLLPWFLDYWSLQIGHAYAQSMEKPRIAIKTPLLGEGISKNTHKYFKYSTASCRNGGFLASNQKI